MPQSTPRPAALILWSLAWAAAIIASAVLLRGHPAGDWVESFLTIGALTFWICLWRPQPCRRR